MPSPESAEGTVGAETSPQPRGMPAFLKLFLGCLGVVALGLVVLAVAVGVGGLALKRGIESTVGSVGEHGDASEALARLEREHPFEPPADGLVTEAQLRRFVAVTDHAWAAMRPWADEVAELQARVESEGTLQLRDALGGARALGGVARARLALADALKAEGVSLGEYAWTGLTLSGPSRCAVERARARTCRPTTCASSPATRRRYPTSKANSRGRRLPSPWPPSGAWARLRPGTRWGWTRWPGETDARPVRKWRQRGSARLSAVPGGSPRSGVPSGVSITEEADSRASPSRAS